MLPAKPGRSPANRSLERGIELLRAFRPGSELLGNAELAERTGLPRATVSRLTQTLVGCGFLEVDPGSRAYRLAPAVLSLGHAVRVGSALLAIAAPRMRAGAEAYQINVGLAAADVDDMVYLESVRHARRASQRTVLSGQRVPMELTSLGRAYLSTVPEPQLTAWMARIQQRRPVRWAVLAAEIRAAIRSVRHHGFCAASWQSEVVAVATPLPFQGRCYALNVSTTTPDALDDAVQDLAPKLMKIKHQIERDILRRPD